MAKGLGEKAGKGLMKLEKNADEGINKIGEDIDQGFKKLAKGADKGIKNWISRLADYLSQAVGHHCTLFMLYKLKQY